MYTPVTKVQSPSLLFFQWSTPDAPNPRLASPIAAADTTITFTSPPLDHAGAVVTSAFLMGIKGSDGYTETVYVPAAAMSIDGLTATGVVRGIRLEGLDDTTSDTGLAVDFDGDSEVFCNVSGVIETISMAALTAQIGAAIKFNDPTTFMEDGILADRVFADATARDAAIPSPANGMSCYNTADGVAQDYIAGAWIDRATGSTPNGSTTVAGKFQAATVAQQKTATSAGSTGALLIPLNSNLVYTPSGAGDDGKIPLLGVTGKLPTGFIDTTALLPSSILNAKGSLITATAASTPAEQLVGTLGQVLMPDSTQANGIKWSDALRYTPNTSEDITNYFTSVVDWSGAGTNGIHLLTSTPTSVLKTLFGFNTSQPGFTTLQFSNTKIVRARTAVSFAVAGTNGTAAWGFAIDATGIGAAQTAVNASIRFVSVSTSIYAVTADGSANTNTLLTGTSVGFANAQTWGIVWDPANTEVKFYINGVLKATHATNIPSGNSTAQIAASANSSTSTTEMFVLNPVVSQQIS